MSGKFLLAIFAAIFTIALAEDDYQLCADVRYTQECQALERGSSKVRCTFITDSVDCLLKMDQGKVDFAALSSEETVLAALAQPEKFSIVASSRNNERLNRTFAFQSVAIVKSSHVGGLKGLSGGGFCHPGYSKAKEQLWSHRVLKFFEHAVVKGNQKCAKDSKSSAEDEAHEISRFFSAACRPGPWVSDPTEDANLKKKFPSLCSLCTNDATPDCSQYKYFNPYATTPTPAVNSHISAIECMASGKGSVAYVAYDHVVEYFKDKTSEISKYALLCQNGSTYPLNSLAAGGEAPCAWVKQPWGSIISRTSVAPALLKDLKTWMPAGRPEGSGDWIDSLGAIIVPDKSNILAYPDTEVNTYQYVVEGRPIPVSENTCHNSIKWCTVSDEENNKCEWVRKTALTVGLSPEVSCVKGASYIDCLSLIKQDRADFISIDSNFGYLARKFYDMTVVLYHETTKALTSKVLALIKEINNTTITRFENLRDKNACFPEYGGIAWVAFVRAAHERKVISPTECDYAYEVGNFFSAACAPGATDPAHFPSKAVDPLKLCAACRGFSPRGNINEQGVVGSGRADVQECPADSSNKFYGVKGALRCLLEPDSNVAFLEGQYLDTYVSEFENMKATDFRVLCRNGSLASYPGYKVDDACALSVTIDSEIVAKKTSKQLLSIRLLLQELDEWFGYNTGSVKLINFQVFSPFDGVKNLLFKDSTIGLATSESTNEYVTNYVELFKHTENCSNSSGITIISSLLLTFISVVMCQLFRQ